MPNLSETFILLLLIHLRCVKPQHESSQAYRPDLDEWLEDRIFLRAQCKAKCLRIFVSPRHQKEFKLQWPNLGVTSPQFDQCFNEQSDSCSSSCFTACDQPPHQCASLCPSHEIGCLVGCGLLLSTLQSGRPGFCPPIPHQDLPIGYSDSSSLIANTAGCKQECRGDIDCPSPLAKCCNVQCNQLCLQPQFNGSVPARAPTLNLIESKANEASDAVELEWNSLSSDDPIDTNVFILQARICVCRQMDAKYAYPWQTLIMTHQLGAKLDAFEHGKVYQFRLATVNSYGTRGFGPASDAYPTNPRPPNPPTPPRNLTDSMWRFYSGGSIDVHLTWQSPELQSTEPPVDEYQIRWVLDHGYVQANGEALEGLTQYAQTIPGNQTKYVIKDLKPMSSYKVQILAFSHWPGYGRLVSQPNTIFLSTRSVHPVYSSQPPNDQASLNILKSEPIDPKTNINSECQCGHGTVGENVFKILKIFYDRRKLVASAVLNLDNDENIYLVKWAAQVCINLKQGRTLLPEGRLKVKASKRLIRITNLEFNCRYIVTMTRSDRSINSRLGNPPGRTSWNELVGQPTTFKSCFCTPSCYDVDVNEGPTPANCTFEDPHLPIAPDRLTVKQISDLRYKVSWRPSGTVDKINSHVKYRLVWGPRIDEPVEPGMYNDQAGFSPLLDYQRSDVRIVDGSQTSIELDRLDPGTLYIVKVQTLNFLSNGKERESRPSTTYFTTLVKETFGRQNRRKGLNSNGLVIKPCPALIVLFLLFRSIS